MPSLRDIEERLSRSLESMDRGSRQKKPKKRARSIERKPLMARDTRKKPAKKRKTTTRKVVRTKRVGRDGPGGNPRSWSVDRRRIDIHQPYELARWAKKFGVSKPRLIKAVQRAGVMVEDVARALGVQGHMTGRGFEVTKSAARVRKIAKTRKQVSKRRTSRDPVRIGGRVFDVTSDPNPERGRPRKYPYLRMKAKKSSRVCVCKPKKAAKKASRDPVSIRGRTVDVRELPQKTGPGRPRKYLHLKVGQRVAVVKPSKVSRDFRKAPPRRGKKKARGASYRDVMQKHGYRN